MWRCEGSEGPVSSGEKRNMTLILFCLPELDIPLNLMTGYLDEGHYDLVMFLGKLAASYGGIGAM